ncbi:MAG: hypothetical protein KC417_06640 [Myxococcales bacterium]|nr:hypothetical protein [Myxococcales bacterium]
MSFLTRSPGPSALSLCLAIAGFAAGCAADGVTTGETYGFGAGGKADGIDGLPCDISDILVGHCVKCHSGPAARKGVHLDSYAGVTAALPSDATKLVAVRAFERMTSTTNPMPPFGQNPVSATDAMAFASWVNAGMPATGCGLADPDASLDAGTLPDAADLDAGDGATTANLDGGAADPFAAPAQCSSGQFWTNGNEGSSRMNPGRACIACHTTKVGAPKLAIAGTVFPTAHEPDTCFAPASQGAQIHITDANGQTVTLQANSAGNFGMFEGPSPLAVPYTAKVEFNGRTRSMRHTQTSGDCNSCHTQSGANGAPGRILLP